MLRLSHETGQRALTVDGTPLGRVRDLVVGGIEHPLVRAVVVRDRGDELLVPWDDIDTFDRHQVLVRTAFAGEQLTGTVDDHLHEHDLLLGRDVLDTQVIDTVGQSVARVSEVLLDRGADGAVTVVGVDVGMGAVIGRLGLHRLGERLPERVVSWHDLHLTSDRGHEVQLASPSAAVHRMDAAALAHLLDVLPPVDAADVLGVIGPQRSAAAIAVAPTDTGARVMAALEADEASVVLQALPEALAQRLRHRASQQSRQVRRRFTRHLKSHG